MHHFGDCFLSSGAEARSKDASFLCPSILGTLTFPGDNTLSALLSATSPPGPEPQSSFYTRPAGDEELLAQTRGHLSSHPPFRDWLVWGFFAGFHHPSQIPLFYSGGT